MSLTKFKVKAFADNGVKKKIVAAAKSSKVVFFIFFTPWNKFRKTKLFFLKGKLLHGMNF
jgi:hypothetical protein